MLLTGICENIPRFNLHLDPAYYSNYLCTENQNSLLKTKHIQ